VKKNKAVIDTGVLISAFAFGGIPLRAVKKAFESCHLYVSQDLLVEYRGVPIALESAGKIDHQQFKALISGIAAFTAKTAIVYPKKKLLICRDPKDNIVLECCHAASADILISGDKDLLEQKDLSFNLEILTPRQFFLKSK
jgi:putative PIN family toxin of toxin-antitoxin system